MFEELENLRKQGKIIGFTASSFDLCHPGHVYMLAEAKSRCDYLVAALLTDPTISRPETKAKPIQTILERFIQLSAIKYVDLIIPFETEEDLEDLLLLLMPDIRFVGEEYRDREHTGKNIEGIKIYYNKRRHNFSSTELRERIKNENL